MIPKRVYLDEEGKNKFREGVRKLAKAVGSTLGPYGRPVIMESEQHIGQKVITKDGVSVAKAIQLYDPVENLAVNIVKEASLQTAKHAGDGTTTACVLTHALLDAADDHMTDKHNPTSVARYISSHSEAILNKLTKLSKAVTKRRLKDIATISSNNDPELGGKIAELFSRVKVVHVENSKTDFTYTEVIDGVKVDRGFSTEYFINNEDREVCELENPYVLLTDMTIEKLTNAILENVFEPIIKNNASLLIIGNMSEQARATLAANVMKKNVRACHIIPPSNGYRQREQMRDLAAVLGAIFYTEESGHGTHNFDVDGLGQAARVVVSADRTIIYKADGENEELDRRVSELQNKLTGDISVNERKDTEARIANLTSGIGIVHVGASSDIEQKELFDRVDDAVRAVGAAIEEGILPGGGVALKYMADTIETFEVTDINEECACDILSQSLYEPFLKILSNAGLSFFEDRIDENINGEPFGYGLNLKTMEYGDMIKMGVIDPALVTKSALKNAVSVATTIMVSECIITNMREGESVQ
jgi:chaperonin GroEL